MKKHELLDRLISLIMVVLRSVILVIKLIHFDTKILGFDIMQTFDFLDILAMFSA